ncbi:MAG: hypothetical protein HGB11_06970 [Chlorobiales bacterium]|nr:hypothetical protein [Chlorobiales bacterium]
MKRFLFFILAITLLASARPILAQNYDLTRTIVHSGAVYSVVYSPDGRFIAAGSEDNSIKVFEVVSGSCLHTLNGHSDWAGSVAYSPDGKLLASGSNDGTIKLWDAGSGSCVRTLNTSAGIVYSVAYSPDGKHLASGNMDRTVKIWDVGRGACVRTLKGHSNDVHSIAYSPDGKFLASGSWDKTVKIWDLRNGACVRTLKGHSGTVNSVVYSPDGRVLASGSDDGAIKIWEIGSGSCTQTLMGHPRYVHSLAYSPDGKTLVSGSGDHTVRIWDVPSGSCVRTLQGENWVKSVAYSPDGETFAAGSTDKLIKIWGSMTASKIEFAVAPKDVPKVVPKAAPGEIPIETPREVVALDNVDAGLPKSSMNNPNAIAIIIGIETYKDIPSVPYAKHDAEVFRAYAENMLGVPADKNHTYLATNEDATRGTFEKLFSEKGWIAKRVLPESDVYVFYAGHGAPDVSSKKAFLIPYDGDANYASQTGFSLERLYDELKKLNARSVTVFLDACFSGGTRENQMILANARPLFVKVDNPVLSSDKLSVFAASSGDQISSGYPEGKHGLFSYCLFKGLKGDADANGDGSITLGELGKYLQTTVSQKAGQLDREQTPELMTTNQNKVLIKH